MRLGVPLRVADFFGIPIGVIRENLRLLITCRGEEIMALLKQHRYTAANLAELGSHARLEPQGADLHEPCPNSKPPAKIKKD